MVDVRYTPDPKSPRKLTAAERDALDALSPEDIERNADCDEDNPPTTEDEFDRAVFARRVRRTRAASGLSQPAFAERYRISVGRLRDWEQGRFQPDTVALAYLAVIEHEPGAVDRALAKAD